MHSQKVIGLMRAAIAQLARVGSLKTLTNNEQEVMTACHEVDKFIQRELSDEDAAEIYRAMLDLFKASKGEYSVQCAIYIAAKVGKLLALCSSLKLWDMIGVAISENTLMSIIAGGHVCKMVGATARSQLPRFVDHILNQEKPELWFAGLHALRSTFKVASSYLKRVVIQTLGFVERVISVSRQQNVVLAALKLLRTLLKSRVTISRIVECAKMAMQNSECPFVLNEVAVLVAAAVFTPYSRLNLAEMMKHDEWAIGAIRKQGTTLNFQPALAVIAQFNRIFASVWTNFLNRMGPELIAMNHKELFNFVRKTAPECVQTLIPMLPVDLRFAYFREVATEKLGAEQLKTLTILSLDDGCLEETVEVALILAVSDDRRARAVAASYFSKLAVTHASVVLQYVKLCLDTLLLSGEKERSDREMNARADILCTILDNLRDVEMATVPNSDGFKRLIGLYFKEPLTMSVGVVNTLKVLGSLPEAFVYTDEVKLGVDFAIRCVEKDSTAEKKKNQRLVRAIYRLRARYPEQEQNKRLIEAAMSVRGDIPFDVISDLCYIIPVTKGSGSLSFSSTRLIMKFALQIKPSTKLMKQHLKRAVPIGHDITMFKKPRSAQQVKLDKFLDRFVRNFPQILDACEKGDRMKLVEMLISQLNVAACLVVTSICERIGSLPDNFCRRFLAGLNADMSRIQIMSECIARYAKVYDVMSLIFEYVDNHDDVSSCILLSAVFGHANVPARYIARSITFLNSMMTSVKYGSIAVHALTSMFLTHHMRLTSRDISRDQFRALFKLVHSPVALQSVSLHMLGEYFKILIELFPSDIDSKFQVFIDLCLRSFELIPMSYGREVYFESARSIYTFAHQMSHLAPIEYPKYMTASVPLQLSACAALSDFLKFEKIESLETDLIRKLLILLQRTSDSRAAQFVIAIAAMMKPEDVSFWVTTIKRIVIFESLLETSDFAIEPTPTVKGMCLEIANLLVPMIAAEPVLSTEHLDDLISSVCRATETDRLVLQEGAFPPLQKVIELFKERLTDEGQRLLDLCDSQFATAVKVGFRVNLAISGNFLSTYLTFNSDGMANDPQNCSAMLVVYLSGLRDCPQRTAAYFSLATHLCSVARKYPTLSGLIQPFMKTLAPIFSDIVLQEMQIFNPASTWRDMTHFRILASAFYRELLSAFVWVQKMSETIIDINVLVSLLVLELKSKQEQWITVAAFEALPVAIEYFGKDINVDLLDLSIRVACEYFAKNSDLVPVTTWTNLLTHTAAILTADAVFDAVRAYLLSAALSSVSFVPLIIGRLLHSDTNGSLRLYAISIFAVILQQWEDSAVPALLTLLFRHSPSVIGVAIGLTLDQHALSIDFKIDIVSRGLMISDRDIPLAAISRFVLFGFKRGAMHMVGRLLVEREDVGVALLADGAVKAAFMLSLVEKGNARAYLRFVHLCITVLCKYEMGPIFARCALRLAIEGIAKYGREVRVHGRHIMSHCVYIAKEAIAILGVEESRALFNSSEENNRAVAVACVSAHIKAIEKRKRTESLVAFSKNEREHKQGEWQSLTVGDDSDGQ